MEFRQHHRSSLRHRGNGFSPVFPRQDLIECDSRCSRDLMARDVRCGGRFAARADIDQQHGVPAPADQPRDEGVLRPFRIQRPYDGYRGHSIS